jgi:hypothetical protein
MTPICLREEGGACDANHECMQSLTCNGGTCGIVLPSEE